METQGSVITQGLCQTGAPLGSRGPHSVRKLSRSHWVPVLQVLWLQLARPSKQEWCTVQEQALSCAGVQRCRVW